MRCTLVFAFHNPPSFQEITDVADTVRQLPHATVHNITHHDDELRVVVEYTPGNHPNSAPSTNTNPLLQAVFDKTANETTRRAKVRLGQLFDDLEDQVRQYSASDRTARPASRSAAEQQHPRPAQQPANNDESNRRTEHDDTARRESDSVSDSVLRDWIDQSASLGERVKDAAQQHADRVNDFTGLVDDLARRAFGDTPQKTFGDIGEQFLASLRNLGTTNSTPDMKRTADSTVEDAVIVPDNPADLVDEPQAPRDTTACQASDDSAADRGEHSEASDIADSSANDYGRHARRSEDHHPRTGQADGRPSWGGVWDAIRPENDEKPQD
ncbi:hypothetical protein CCHOA_08050 [Corynebacterium choanae]|uniref:Uncharacterized protein n=1 Tax=Corynebacterium choanae TaxID=1862358 RepID=A0A3G6J869_9CORY|nr:hypothetical protein CCHOA_08050 [Corynebacterium choanae]